MTASHHGVGDHVEVTMRSVSPMALRFLSAAATLAMALGIMRKMLAAITAPPAKESAARMMRSRTKGVTPTAHSKILRARRMNGGGETVPDMLAELSGTVARADRNAAVEVLFKYTEK